MKSPGTASGSTRASISIWSASGGTAGTSFPRPQGPALGSDRIAQHDHTCGSRAEQAFGVTQDSPEPRQRKVGELRNHGPTLAGAVRKVAQPEKCWREVF